MAFFCVQNRGWTSLSVQRLTKNRKGHTLWPLSSARPRHPTPNHREKSSGTAKHTNTIKSKRSSKENYPFMFHLIKLSERVHTHSFTWTPHRGKYYSMTDRRGGRRSEGGGAPPGIKPWPFRRWADRITNTFTHSPGSPQPWWWFVTPLPPP